MIQAAPLRGVLLSVLAIVLGGCAATAPAPAGAPPVAQGGAPVQVREIGNLVLEDLPAIPDALPERLRQYQSARGASLQGWLPDGSLLVRTRFADTAQIHRVRSPGGERRQLTFFTEPVAGAEPSPDPQHPGFLYLRDVGGAEAYQLFFMDLATGRSQRISDGRSRNSAPIFDRSGGQIAWASTRRNGRDTDVWVGSVDGRAQRALTRESGSWAPVQFSPDGRRLLVRHYVSRSESTAFVADLDSGALTPVLDPDLGVRIDDLAFDRDGTTVYFSSDLGGDFVRLYRVARPGAPPVAVTGDVDWDLERFAISPDGRYLVWSMNEETRSRLYVRDLVAGSFVALPEIPEGVVYGLSFSPDSTRLGFTVNGATSPGDVHVVDLAHRSLTRWTHSEVGGLDSAAFVAPEHFRYPTFDRVAPDGPQRTVPAFIYRPPVEGSAEPAPRPVIISLHGGPESQARPYFSPTIQFWVNELGAAVIVPNVRGSTGYGRAWHQLDDGYRREDSVRDVGALLDWIDTQDDLDPSRVMVTGGSYGGYMVLAALAMYPDRIAAGAETVGISNFVTFLEQTSDYRRDLRRAEYGDERDPDMRAFLESISPLTKVDALAAPLLVIQGANDPRVPAGESRQIVDALRARGEDAWYLLATDEGHGFRKRANRDVAAAVTALFIERFLLDGGRGDD